jgi:hypothetical protein
MKMSIKTAKEAIEISVKESRIVHTCLPMDEADNLGVASDDCVTIHTEPRMVEYWGSDEGGNEWRVHDHEKESSMTE